MSKAILVTDMPNKCGECIFKKLHSDADKTWCCGLIATLKGEIHCVDKHDFPDSSRPDWCPLKPMPEKMEEHPKEYYEFGNIGLAFDVGYNACIDKISGQLK